jgi:hypothetical protein
VWYVTEFWTAHERGRVLFRTNITSTTCSVVNLRGKSALKDAGFVHYYILERLSAVVFCISQLQSANSNALMPLEIIWHPLRRFLRSL